MCVDNALKARTNVSFIIIQSKMKESEQAKLFFMYYQGTKDYLRLF